jgi:hypothetical protein
MPSSKEHCNLKKVCQKCNIQQWKIKGMVTHNSYVIKPASKSKHKSLEKEAKEEGSKLLCQDIEESNQKAKPAPLPVSPQANNAIAFKMNIIITYL